jgi:hypothetical protein
MQIRVPFGSICAVRYHTSLVGAVPHRSRRETLTCVIAAIVSMVDWTEMFTSLKSEVEFLPSQTMTVKRSTFHQIRVPHGSIGTVETCAVKISFVPVRVLRRTRARAITWVKGVIEGTYLNTSLVSEVILLRR